MVPLVWSITFLEGSEVRPLEFYIVYKGYRRVPQISVPIKRPRNYPFKLSQVPLGFTGVGLSGFLV